MFTSFPSDVARRCLLLCLLLCLRLVCLAEEPTPWRLGIVDGCSGQWGFLETYLEQKYPGHDFSILKLSKKDLAKSLEDRKVDFLVACPCQALTAMPPGVRLVPVATIGLHTGNNGEVRSGVAGALLVPKSQKGIQEVEDISGKTIAISALDDYAWLMLRHELCHLGLAPETVGIRLVETGSGEGVLEALRKEQADAGVFSTVDLLRLGNIDRIRLAEWRVLNRQPPLPGMDIPRSTAFYPGMTFFALAEVPEEMVSGLQNELLLMPADSPLFKGSCMAGWHLPVDGYELERLLAQLELTKPSRPSGRGRVAEFLQAHPENTILLVVLLALLIVLFVALRKVVRYRKAYYRRMAADSRTKAELQVGLESVMNCSDDGILILDHDGRCLHVNNAAMARLGWTHQEMRGVPFDSLVRHTHPDGKEFTRAELPDQLACQHGITSQEEHLILWTKKGLPLHVSYKAHRLRLAWKHLGALIVFSDISQQLHQVEEKEEALHQFEADFEADPQAGLIIGLDGFCLEGNSAAVALFGYSSCDEFAGHTLAEFSSFRQGERNTPSVGLLNGYYQRLETESQICFPWTFMKLDGTEFPCQVLMSLETLPGLGPLIRISIDPVVQD